MKKIKSLTKAETHARALEIAMELVEARAEVASLRKQLDAARGTACPLCGTLIIARLVARGVDDA